jgi:hypothetical protein
MRPVKLFPLLFFSFSIKAQTKKMLFINVVGCLPAVINSTNSPNVVDLETIGTYSHDTCDKVPCTAPSGISVTAITGFGANIQWAHTTGINNYTIEYKPVASGSWIKAGTAAADSFIINGLSPKITYDYRVKAICSGYTTGTFTTINEVSYCFEYDISVNTWPSGTLIKTFNINPVNGLSMTKTISGAVSKIVTNSLSSEYSTNGVNSIFFSVDVDFDGTVPNLLNFDYVFNKPVKINNVRVRDIDRTSSYIDVVKVQGTKWDNTSLLPSLSATNRKYVNITNNEAAAKNNGATYNVPQTPDIEGENGDIYFGFDTVRMRSYRIIYTDSLTNPDFKGIYLGGFCVSYTPPVSQDINNLYLSSNGTTPPAQNINPLQYGDDDGTVTAITFTSLPDPLTQGTLYLNGMPVTLLAQLTNLSTAAITQLAFQPAGSYDGTVVLNYYATDNDGYQSIPSTYTIPVVPILPLNLLNFTAQLHTTAVWLEWNTTNETSVKKFILERSVNGSDYTATGTVSAANNIINNSYRYEDRDLSFSRVFYRLKIVDIDGRYSYSPVRLISRSTQNGLIIFPNPVKNVLNITLGGIAQIRNLRIYDGSSRLVYSGAQQQTSADINVSNLSNGTYVIECVDENGISYRSRFIKE